MRLKKFVAAGLAACALALVGAAAWLLHLNAPPPGYGADRTAEIFRDCADCPEMLTIPAGEGPLGAKYGRLERWFGWLGFWRAPPRTVTIARPFAVARTETTFAQWNACVVEGGCNGYAPPDEGWGRSDRPVIHVSWEDAQAYVRWLSAKTGARYRLPSEAEWEYAARSGAGAPYPWGPRASHERANYGVGGACCTGAVSGRDQWEATAPVGQFPANAFGLQDMNGNVYEWVADCYADDPELPPANGDAVQQKSCTHRVMRGGAWYSGPLHISSYYRSFNRPDLRYFASGFRVAKTLESD